MNISSEHIIVREVTSSLESVEEIEQLADDCANKFCFTEELRFNIQVALVEAVNNAIIHGNKQGHKKTVIITCVQFKDYLRFSIKDEGFGFNVNDNPNPISAQKIDKPDGRGLFLIKKLCDNVQFIDGGRIIQIDFKDNHQHG